MAPKIVAVNKGAQPPVSPIPIGYFRPRRKQSEVEDSPSSQVGDVDALRSKYNESQNKVQRLKKERESNKKMLLEMSTVLKSLQGISVQYEKSKDQPTSSNTNFDNVLRKIKAIDKQLKSSTVENSHLQEEKSLQRSTIKAQESQIKTMEDEISLLQQQLKQVITSAHGKVNLEGQTNSAGNDANNYYGAARQEMTEEILALKQQNAAKYSEIDALESRLQALRNAQAGSSGNPDTEAKPQEESTSESSQSSDSSDSNQLVVYNPMAQLQRITGYLGITQPKALEAIAEDGESQCPSVVSSSSQSSSSRGTSKNTASASVSQTQSEEGGVMITLRSNGNGYVSDVSHCTDDFSSCSSGKLRASQSQYSASSGWDTVSINSQGSSTQASSKDESQVQQELERVKRQYKTLKAKYDSNIREHNPLEDEYNLAMNRVEELEKENKKLRDNNSQVLNAMAEVSQATATANKLKMENEAYQKSLEELKSKNSMATTLIGELKQEKSEVLKVLEEERAEHAKAKVDLSRMQRDIVNYNKLQELHEMTVEKLADMAEENDALQGEVFFLKDANSAQSSEAARKLESIETTVAKLEETKTMYSNLQNDHEVLTDRASQLCDQYERLQEKYRKATSKETFGSALREEYDQLLQEYETCQARIKELEDIPIPESDEKLKQAHKEALAKLTVLEESNKELQITKAKYDAAEEKISVLEQVLERAARKAESAKKKQEQRVEHLQDVIHQYKELEKEHKAVSSQLRSLQSLVAEAETPAGAPSLIGTSSHKRTSSHSRANSAFDMVEDDDRTGHSRSSSGVKAAAVYARLTAYEGRMKDLEKQRDDALKEIKEIKEELVTAQKEAANATEAKNIRERDLKIVLKYYEELQTNYEEALARIETLESEAAVSQRSTESTSAHKSQNEMEETEESEDDDEDSENAVTEEQTQDRRAAGLAAIAKNTSGEPAVASIEQAPSDEGDAQDGASVASSEIYLEMEEANDKTPKAGVEAAEGEAEATEPTREEPDASPEEMMDDETAASTDSDDTATMAETATENGSIRDPADTHEAPRQEEVVKKDGSSNKKLGKEQEPVSPEEETHCSTYAGSTALGREPEHETAAQHNKEPSGSGRHSRHVTTVDASDDDDSIQKLLIDMAALKRQKQKRLGGGDASTVSNVSAAMSFDSAETSSVHTGQEEEEEKPPADPKITQLLDELQQATDRVIELEEEQQGAQAKLEILERKLVISRREAEEAKTRQEAREGNLRDVVTKHKKLEEDHQRIIARVGKLEEELEHAKKEARIREEEARGARKRLAGCHYHYKKLQDEHEVALKRILEQDQELEECRLDASFIEDASNMRKFRNDCMADKVRLLKENAEIKFMCNQLLVQIEENKQKE